MKNCGDYADQISVFLDGELSGPERGELMEHMAVCPNCRQYFDDLAAIREAAGEIAEVPVPEGFARRVMDRVRTVEQDRAVTPEIIRFPWRRWTALAACCALVLLGAWGFLNFQNRKASDLTVSQEMAADDMARTAVTAGMPGTMDGGESGVMAAADREQPVGEVLSRMADGESEMAEEEDAAWEAVLDGYAKDAIVTEAAKDAPAPSPTAPADMEEEAAVMETAKDAPALNSTAFARNAAGGTLIAGGDLARRWVEDELGLEWESGRVYALSEEQYAELAELLTKAGAAFRVEDGDACRLVAE